MGENYSNNGSLENIIANHSKIVPQDAPHFAVFIGIMVTNFFGSAANIILLLAMIRCPPLRKSSSSALIMHCIIIDLCTTLLAMPSMMITSQIGAVYNLPETACKFQSLYVYIVFPLNMYASCILAIHRLIATIFPRKFDYFTKKPAIIFMIIFPWIVAFIIDVFPAFQIGSKVVKNLSGSGGCIVITTKRFSLIVSTIFGYYVPTILIGVSYVIVLCKTKYAVHRRRTSRSLRRRLEISRMLFVSFLWHCITIYPAMVFVTLFLKQFTEYQSLQLAIKWLGSSFSAVNPVRFSHSTPEGISIV